MYLSKRSDTLLRDLLIHPRRTSKELQSIYNLSRRQVDYSIEKLNHWLKEKSYPRIEHTSSGHFVASSKLLTLMSAADEEKTNDWYLFSQKERSYIIILMIITKNESLSMSHFISELGVSRNTVLRDLKLARDTIAPYQLDLVYSRKQGYEIVGKEWDARFILIKIINHLINIYGGESYLKHFMNLPQEQVAHWRTKLEKVESRLNLKFIDLKMQILPYVLEGVFKRINQGYTIDKEAFFVSYEGLSDTREYSAAEFLIEDRVNLPKQERMYITLQVLTSNIIPSQDFMLDEIPQLEQSLMKCLNLFEANACIRLKNKAMLLKKLMIHFKPAYYRIKYHLTIDHSGLHQIDQEYKILNYFVKKSLDPLRKLIGEPIPDTEVLFISLFIGSHLINYGDQLGAKLKAAIVCTNGVSLSLLMEKTLKGLFPEMIFYKAMSVREFSQMQYPCDVVFSPIPIATKAKLFIVNEVMGNKEKTRLRHNVIKEIYQVDQDLIDVEKMIDLVEKYADIKEKSKLQSALNDLLIHKVSQSDMREDRSLENKDFYRIDELLPASMIQQVNRVENWQQALEWCAKPLQDRKLINGSYLNRLNTLYRKPLRQIILGKHLALPHSEPKYGVEKLSMSLLHIREGLKTDGLPTIYFVVILAPIDKKSHFNALLELTKIAQSTSFIEKMRHAGSCRQLHGLIKEFGENVSEKMA
ncbi:BglG family transcription antiterminator [Sporolactobacillus shoreicorticis]|uniref:Ascorbate-specific PTS system EIIA component n=1 Tax=Sporolactobacillus shoreicorticis TaxID=1923877 RepID=A0ABW5S2W5_9BACL|nr:BglG family transcription antiterminator [Sporolactobacillus shoreicorticis]MCO7128316.1 BglG family transcription antiterminator [Sporolactobacillus shoreicorticis]